MRTLDADAQCLFNSVVHSCPERFWSASQFAWSMRQGLRHLNVPGRTVPMRNFTNVFCRICYAILRPCATGVCTGNCCSDANMPQDVVYRCLRNNCGGPRFGLSPDRQKQYFLFLSALSGRLYRSSREWLKHKFCQSRLPVT